MCEAQVVGAQVAQEHLPHRGHTSRQSHFFVFKQFINGFAVQRRTWEDQLGAHHGRAVRDAPSADVEHGHHRQNRISRRQTHHIGQGTGVSVKDGGAVAVKRRFGVARGAAGVAHAGGRVFIQSGPCVVAGLLAHPAFIADQARDAAVGRQFVGVAQGHPTLHRCASLMNLFGNRQEGHVKAHHLVFGMVGDPHNLIRMQAGVEGMNHTPTAAHPEIQLQMTVAVPSQGCDSGALANLPLVQSIGDLA